MSLIFRPFHPSPADFALRPHPIPLAAMPPGALFRNTAATSPKYPGNNGSYPQISPGPHRHRSGTKRHKTVAPRPGQQGKLLFYPRSQAPPWERRLPAKIRFAFFSPPGPQRSRQTIREPGGMYPLPPSLPRDLRPPFLLILLMRVIDLCIDKTLFRTILLSP